MSYIIQSQRDGLRIRHIGQIHRHGIASISGFACKEAAASGHTRIAVDQLSVKRKDKRLIAARVAALYSRGVGSQQGFQTAALNNMLDP